MAGSGRYVFPAFLVLARESMALPIDNLCGRENVDSTAMSGSWNIAFVIPLVIMHFAIQLALKKLKTRHTDVLDLDRDVT